MIRLSQLPQTARNWSTNHFVNWCIDNGIEVIVNDRIPRKPYIEHELSDFIDTRLWEHLKDII